ncbi:MAG TPA: hypothetical protein VGS41_03375, partial [Chthonomonadales bacterium]|nr:hypothetical protein [Chthonomonadales bacterium]
VKLTLQESDNRPEALQGAAGESSAPDQVTAEPSEQIRPYSTPEQWLRLLDALGSRRKAVRRAAAVELGSLAPESLEPLLRALSMESRRRSARRKTILGCVAGWYALVLLTSAVTHQWGLCITLGSETGLVVWSFAATRRQKKAATVLPLFRDVRAVGALAEGLEYHDAKVRKDVELALIPLLYQVKASDAQYVSTPQMRCLIRALKSTNDSLVLATLKAFEQIGDETAIPNVERLASGGGRAAENPSLMHASQECLPCLGRRAELHRAQQSLLRASAPEAASQQTLLRPALGGRSDDDPCTLLRGASSDEEDCRIDLPL